MRLNIAAFSTKFENLQLTIQQGVAPITTNAADATIKGLEVEVQLNPAEGLNITGSVGLLDASYDSPPPFPIQPELANAPDLVMPPFLVGFISRLVFKRHVSCEWRCKSRPL